MKGVYITAATDLTNKASLTRMHVAAMTLFRVGFLIQCPAYGGGGSVLAVNVKAVSVTPGDFELTGNI